MTQKTQGIVIKRMNFGEADRILTILTERFGKVKAMAKGIRKGKSKLAGSLEPFMLVDLMLHEGKTFFLVTGAEIVESYDSLHQDIQKISKAFYLGELIDRFVEEHQVLARSFPILRYSLKSIDAGASDLATRIFELKMIEAAGFQPQLYECVHCKTKLTALQNYWDEVEGGVICGKCQDKFRHGEEISNNAIKILRLIEKSDHTLPDRLKLSPGEQAEVSEILAEYIKSIIERELKSARFMRQVTRDE